MMDWGFTLPREHVNDFETNLPVKIGTSREIGLIWDKKRYSAKLCHVNRKGATSVHQIRWDNNRTLLKKLRKTFIQSYVILKSQKELFDIGKEKGKHFRTSLAGGQQEVLIFQPLNSKEILCKVFIKIDNNWSALFTRLAEENVFGWLFDREKRYLITKTTHWINVKNLKKHVNAINIIYYLAHTKKKLLYIGKAENLGKRLKPGKNHQQMPGDWDYFKYDIVKPDYSNLLERIEDHTIRSFAAVLKNKTGYPSLEISDYTLVNTNWKKL